MPQFNPSIQDAPYTSFEEDKNPQDLKCQVIIQNIILELLTILPDISAAYDETVIKYDDAKKLSRAQKKFTNVIIQCKDNIIIDQGSFENLKAFESHLKKVKG
jgi:hypothetical protein